MTLAMTVCPTRQLPLITLTLRLACGCGPPTDYVVHGMVVFPDGQPLQRDTVEFEAIGQSKPITASGEVASDGTFRLGTDQPNDGVIAGEHRGGAFRFTSSARGSSGRENFRRTA
jgi:hypothetical protein